MPDTNLPNPSAIEPSATTQSPSQGSSTSFSAQASEKNRVHIVLQGKGGVGKSLIAFLIAQYLVEKNKPVTCIDADPINATLCETEALQAKAVRILEPGTENVCPHALDDITKMVLEADGNVVLDSGATSFAPLSRYLLQDGIIDAIYESGKGLVIHTVVAGGPELLQTGRAFDSIATQFPANVGIVLWLNEHHGPVVGADGGDFEDTVIFKRHAKRIMGLIKLRKLDPFFGKSFAAMREQRLTFAQATSTEGGLFVLDRSRLSRLRFHLWSQIEQVL